MNMHSKKKPFLASLKGDKKKCTRKKNSFQEDGMNWKTEVDIYTQLCIKQVTNTNLVLSDPG